MLERAPDLVKIDVSGLVFRGCFKAAFKRRFPVVDPILNIPKIVEKSKGEAGIAIHPLTTGPVLLSLNANVATITLDRPDNGNRIDEEMAAALGEACRLGFQSRKSLRPRRRHDPHSHQSELKSLQMWSPQKQAP